MKKSKYSDILTEEFLVREYVVGKKSMHKIAKERKCSISLVNSSLLKFHIKIRDYEESLKLRRKYNKILTKKFLIQEYIDKGKLIKQIAKEAGCGKTKIQRYLKKYKIKTNNRYKYIKTITKKILVEEYHNKKLTMKQIADDFNCAITTIKGALNKYHIPINKRIKKKYYCKECGKETTKVSGKYGQGRCKSCSRKGKLNYNYQNKKQVRKCDLCNKNTKPKYSYYSHVFCSKKCKNKFQSLNMKGDKAPVWKGGKPKCKICHKLLSAYHCKYCDDCIKGIMVGEKASNWKGGKSFEPYPLGWTKTFKEQIRYRDKYKCQLCGCPEVENGRRLSIHHIDYDKQNLNIDNLISLCNKCHSKTNGNRDYWIIYFNKINKEEIKCKIK